ncbi:MAG: hypothetical protein GY702_15820 [Desulfobulbaceae bacterium]|nr:hypothetical protein [Desulfobulbaceae bacterium]
MLSYKNFTSIVCIITFSAIAASSTYAAIISGTISNHNSEEIFISAFVATNACEYWGEREIADTTSSATNGTYSFTVPDDQNYYLRFDPQGGSNSSSLLLKEYWTSSGQGWNCGNAESFNPTIDTSSKNITLETGTIVSGTITGNNSEPIFVSVFFDLGCYGNYFDSVDSSLGGSYSILVPNNQPIGLSFDPQTGFEPSYGTNEDSFLIDELWTSDGQGTRDCSMADIFNPTTDNSNKNITLEPGGKITGTVFESDGVTPISNESFFSVSSWTGNPCDYNIDTGSGVNFPDGTYEIVLLPGTYYISTGNAVSHYDAWWTTSGISENCYEASPIVVSLLQEESGKNFSLTTYAEIKTYENWNTLPALDNSWGNSYISDFNVFIDNGELHHLLRPYSATAASSVIQARSRFQSSNARDITAFRSTIRLDSIGDISQATEIDYASAEFFSFFYNQNTNASNAAGDILFLIRFGDRGNGLEAWYFLSRIEDANYATSTELASGIFTPPPGGWQTGVSYALEVNYDGASSFTSTLGSQPTEPLATVVGPTRGSAAHSASTFLRSRISLKQPFKGDPDLYKLDTVFDNIMVDNGSGLISYDSFDGADPALSLSLWHKDHPIGQATVTDNMLKLGVKVAPGDTITDTQIKTRATLPTAIHNTDTLQIDMKMDGTIVPDESARTELRAGGSWGNGLYTSVNDQGYDGTDGKIYMFARLEKAGNSSNYRVVCAIDMDDKSQPEGYQSILFETAEAEADTLYTAYLRKRGTLLECIITNTLTKDLMLSISKQLPTAGIPYIAPLTESKEISIRVRNSPAEVIGYFDNLLVDEMPGDIDMNATIDLIDVILGLQILSGANPTSISTFGDISGDGKVGLEETVHNMLQLSEM